MKELCIGMSAISPAMFEASIYPITILGGHTLVVEDLHKKRGRGRGRIRAQSQSLTQTSSFFQSSNKVLTLETSKSQSCFEILHFNVVV
jgi:hypothetical protein